MVTRKPVRKELSDYLVGSLIFIGFVYFLHSWHGLYEIVYVKSKAPTSKDEFVAKRNKEEPARLIKEDWAVVHKSATIVFSSPLSYNPQRTELIQQLPGRGVTCSL